MRREIKFRARYENVTRGEKVGDGIVWSKTSYYDYDPIIDNKGLCSVESGWDIQGHEDKNDYVLEQYTGLKDKNGKEIYEGDIVEYDWYIVGSKPSYRVKEQVIFDDMGARVGNDRIRLCTNVEVIGNIHEDSDLLGGKNGY